MAQKKNNKASKQDIRLKEDIASFKASVVFLLFCAVIFFTVTKLSYERDSLYLKFRLFIENNPYVLAIFFVLLGLCCVWKYLNVKNKKDESYKYFSSSDACAVSLFLLVYVLTLVVTYHMPVILTVIVAYALCYYVKHFYGKDFFLFTLLNLDMALALFLAFGNLGTSGGISTFVKILFAAAALIGFLAIIYSAWKLLSDKAKFKAEKLTLIPAAVSLAVGAVLAILCFTMPETVTILAAEIVLLVQYVGLGVYYTVRLLNQ